MFNLLCSSILCGAIFLVSSRLNIVNSLNNSSEVWFVLLSILLSDLFWSRSCQIRKLMSASSKSMSTWRNWGWT